MKNRKLILGLVRLLTLLLLHHPAAFSNDTTFDVPIDAGGCTVFIAPGRNNFNYSWNGQCRNGKAQGLGILSLASKKTRDSNGLWIGNWIDGLPSGLIVIAWREENDLNTIRDMVLFGFNPPGNWRAAQYFFDGAASSSRSALEKSIVGTETLAPSAAYKEIDFFLQNSKRTTVNRVTNLATGNGSIKIPWPQTISPSEFLPPNNPADDPKATGYGQRMSR